ncbi:MAG: RraA family protein [Stackebrandtia sp.]
MYIEASTESIEVHAAGPGTDPAVVAELGGYPAANIGDALDRLGLMHSGIGPVWPRARCAGTVLPILTREGDNLAIHRALDEARPGDVLVVNGMGDGARALFGDLLAEMCLARSVAGVIVDGAVRDAEAIAETGLPVFARAVTPAGPTKTGPGVIGLPVACGGVVCRPGDLAVADSDGVAIVPRDRLDGVLSRLTEIEARESALRIRIRDL